LSDQLLAGAPSQPIIYLYKPVQSQMRPTDNGNTKLGFVLGKANRCCKAVIS
jgi:hypothetical protein